MSDSVLKGILGVIALFMFGNAIGFWFALDSIMPLYGLSTTSELGRAGTRADFGGFFWMAALLAGYAAYQRHALAALAGACIFYFGLTGRLVSVILEGPAPDGLAPMLVEVLFGSILLYAWSRWRAA